MDKKDDLFQTIAAITRGGFNPPPVFPEFITKIDWKLLREQKTKLIYLMNRARCTIEIEEDDSNAIEGIISLIDAIQDYSTDIMGLSEEEVFNLTPEDDEINN